MSSIPDSSRPETISDALLWGSNIDVEIVTDHKLASPIDTALVRTAVTAAALDQGFDTGEIGIRVTDDATIQQINRQYLGHDYPTDVISFDYDSERPHLHGEMVVSLETASQRAMDLGWPTLHELLLYVVHGTLHIAGLNDLNAAQRRRMRDAEQRVMRGLGIERVRWFDPASGGGIDARVQQDAPPSGSQGDLA